VSAEYLREGWLSMKQAMAFFGVSKPTICRWVRNGKLQRYGCDVIKDPGGHWYVKLPRSRKSKMSLVSEGLNLS